MSSCVETSNRHETPTHTLLDNVMFKIINSGNTIFDDINIYIYVRNRRHCISVGKFYKGCIPGLQHHAYYIKNGNQCSEVKPDKDSKSTEINHDYLMKQIGNEYFSEILNFLEEYGNGKKINDFKIKQTSIANVKIFILSVKKKDPHNLVGQ
jgi:hypothetical protein